MTCYDIIFPMALGPLTYICPDNLAGSVEPGMLVAAPLRKRVATGIVLRKSEAPPPGPLKELTGLPETSPVLSRPMLRLLLWMSEYYVASEGLLLKQTLPAEVFEKTKPRIQKKTPGGEGLRFTEMPPEVLQPVLDGLQEKKFRPFLYHAGRSVEEYSMVRGLCPAARNIIIVAPEIAQADMLYAALREEFGERVCVLHSDMSKGRRSAYVEGIIENRHDIVVGTRPALFSPMKKVSLIVVLHEHSSFYKMEEGIRFHIRDVAVKRASLEKAAVVLSSITPSVDSYYNALSGKYALITAGDSPSSPRVSLVDMRYSRKASPHLSRTAVNLSGSRLKIGKNVMFLVNRKGYATLLCRECENVEACTDCGIPMVMHKEAMALRCHYCGKGREIPLLCSRCRSPRLEPIGSGTERVREEIEKLLGREAIVIDKDRIKTRPEMTAILKTIAEAAPNLVIGTKLLTAHISIMHRFSLAVVINVDASMNFPDFRASEKAYAELSSILDHIEPEGDLLIQTRTPANPMLKYFKTGDYRSFVMEELQMRRALFFPPFSRMAAITVSGKTDVTEDIVRSIRKSGQPVEVLGPVASTARGGLRQLSLFLKATDRKALNRAVRGVAEGFGAIKDIRVRVDIDPA